MFELLYNFNGINQAIFSSINKFTNISFLPLFFQAISWPFNIENFALYYILFSLHIFLKLKRKSKYSNIKSSYWVYYNYLFKIGIIYTIFGLTYALLKFSINLPRPFCSSEHYLTIKNITLERCLSSFPSSHVGLSIIIAYAIWPFISINSKRIYTLVIILVAISRLTLAMHYPSDIIYSVIVVAIVIWLGRQISNKLKPIATICGKFLYNFI